MLRSIRFAILAVAACTTNPPPGTAEPPSDATEQSALQPEPEAPTSEPSADPAPSAEPSAEPAPSASTGMGCYWKVGDACFDSAEKACKAAGCTMDRCIQSKSMPVQVSCQK